jgi:hypothetical protein
MPEYRRRLPHFHPHEAYLLLTWRLWGSLPTNLDVTVYPTLGHAFLAQDRALEGFPSGPLWLRDSRIANLVAQAILDRRWRKAFLSSFCLGGYAQPGTLADPCSGSNAWADEVVERIDGQKRKPDSGPDRAAVLARRVLRSLPAPFESSRAHHRLHRGKPCQSRISGLRGALAMVQRGLAGETPAPQTPLTRLPKMLETPGTR